MRVRLSLVVLLATALVLASCAVAFAAVPTPPYSANSQCLECHAVSAGGPAFSKVDFAAASVDYGKCATCHSPLWMMPHEHFSQYSNCQNAGCHQFGFPTPNVLPATASTAFGSFLSPTSVAATPQQLHAAHVNGGWVIPAFNNPALGCDRCHQPASCTACHAAPPAHGSHAATSYPAVTYKQAFGASSGITASTCVNPSCHALSAAGTAAFTPSCGGCHATKTVAHGYETTTHAAADSSTGGVACSSCHSLELGPEHAKSSSSSAAASCGACHPSPRNTVSAWDHTCATGGCHTTSSSAPMHANVATAHQVVAGGQVCLGCHSGSDLASIHTSATATTGAKSCLVCHSSGATPATNDCTVCHFKFADHYGPVRHTSTWTLTACTGAGCHGGTNDLMSAHTDKNAAFTCAGCHSSTRPEVIAAIAAGDTACGACHSNVSQASGHRASHWATPLLQDGSGPKYSYYAGSKGTQPTGDCAGCHVSNIMDEHLGLSDAETGNPVRLPRKDASGAALTCATCHASLDPRVSSAIALGKTACDDCHAVHGPIPQIHTSTFIADAQVKCSACHSASLPTLHDGGFTVVTPSGTSLSGCDVCHAYYEGARGAQVQAAISVTNDTKCSACHAVTHRDLGGHSATSTASMACGACHAGSSGTSMDTKAVHAKASLGACAVCHDNSARVADITTKSPECASCHAAEKTDYHRTLSTVHASTQSACAGAGCHSLADVTAVHSSATTTVAGVTLTGCQVCHRSASDQPSSTDCKTCHAGHGDLTIAHTATQSTACTGCHKATDVRSIHKTKQCAACHGNPAIPTLPSNTECASCHTTGAFHAQQDAMHTGLGTSGTCQGAGCHPSRLLPQDHELYVGPGSANPQYATTCDLCHLNTDPNRINWATATASCSSCHGAPHDRMNHQATSATSQECVACHGSAWVVKVHGADGTSGGDFAKCATCHNNPTKGNLAAGKTNGDCEQCHALSPAGTNHYKASAHVASEGTNCSDCHLMPLVAEHDRATGSTLTCLGCHTSAKFGALARPWNGTCSGCHASKHSNESTAHVSAQTACAGSNCHAITNLETLHSAATTTVAGVTYSGCRVCHRSPTQQPTSSDCKACHAGHGDVTALHAAPESTECVACHETADVMVVHAGSAKGQCAVCHNNPAVPVLPPTAKCVNCHAAFSPSDPNHYPAASHTATDAAYSGLACSACHSLEMKPEHAKASSGSVTCVQCHETKVDALAGAWNKTCAACHTTTLHAQQSTKHVSTRTACAGTGCHVVTNVATVHSKAAGGGCALCHTSASAVPTTTDCNSAGCHPGITGSHEAAHDVTGVVDSGCAGCHYTYLTTEHLKLGYTCGTCHDSTNAAVTAAIAAKDVSCDGCHPAVNGKNRHASQAANEFVVGNSSGHRAYAALPGMRTSFSVGGATYNWPLPASFLKSGWTATSMVQCDDCHTFASTAGGPHGSSVAVNIDPAYSGDMSNAALSGSGTSPSNLICTKCHTNFGGMNNVHGAGDHRGNDGKCVLCHSQIPHGWRLPRMLAYTSDPAPYASTGLTGISLSSQSPNGWGEPDCSTSCGEHSSSMANRWPSVLNTYGTLRGTVKSTAGVGLAGATVTTDKGDSATAGAMGAYDLGLMPTGTYQVTVALTGYVTQTKSVTLTANQTSALDFSLAAVPTTGTLVGTVTSAANGAALQGASVAISGGASATSSSSGAYTFTNLSAGTYTVTYSMAGYVSQTKSITITAGQTTTSSVALAVQSVNLALNKSATSSGNYSSYYDAAKAFDGSLTTYWRSSSSGTQWLRVDLGSSQSVSKFVVDWNGTNYARAYRIETSTDGTNWTQRYSFTSSYSNPGGDNTVTLSSAVAARYVRLYCTSANQSSYQVTEFEVRNQ